MSESIPKHSKSGVDPLRILCFGDSLTEGYSQFGFMMTPYSETLQAELEVKFLAKKDERELVVVTDGMSGDLLTTGSFRGRMTSKYTPATPNTPRYHWTIFLGGTNDLGWGKAPVDIWTSTKAITAIPLLHGSKVLLMTVPECAAKSESLDRKRDALNKYIREDGREGVYTFDLHAAIPYHSMPESERNEIWDDGLHFTPQGYERMGELVAARLVEILDAENDETGQEGQ